MVEFRFFGHRGAGASDAQFNRERDAEAGLTDRPAENTLLSHLAAMAQGAKGTETDLIEPADDNNIVLSHSNEFAQHVFSPAMQSELEQRGWRYLDQMTVTEIHHHLRTGVAGLERIPTLGAYARAVLDARADALLQLELKGKQHTSPDHQRPTMTGGATLAEKSVRILDRYAVPMDQVRFSSFSTSYLAEAADARPEAELAILTDLTADLGGDVGLRMFMDRPDQYLQFTPDAIDYALDQVPGIRVVHAEVQSLTDENVAYLAQRGLKLGVWGWKEYAADHPGGKGSAFAQAYLRAAELCERHGIAQLDIITDHIPQTRALLERRALPGGPQHP